MVWLRLLKYALIWDLVSRALAWSASKGVMRYGLFAYDAPKPPAKVAGSEEGENPKPLVEGNPFRPTAMGQQG